MSPQVQRHEPPYKQVVRHIRAQIMSGELKHGDRIPSARQLTKDWEISLATAVKVHNTLRAEGLVRGVSGVGTMVSTQDMVLGARDRLAASRKGKIYPKNEFARIISAELIAAPEHVADGLGVTAGAPVLRRIRVTYREGSEDAVPVSASTSWFDGAVVQRAPRLLETERIPEGTPAYIEACTSRVMTSADERVTVSTATEEEAQTLQLDPDSPILRGQNRILDQDDAVIEFGEFVSGPNRWRSYFYEIK
ncbi:GntR family transcriptional regulator [Nocardiopsis halophila]|uniref:GntR family transcriptional regulator n=1 Tax=Nocardiopsis halophila TaxID=141692 RepID=UPI0003476875|nr:GntR family transcriptional regulator [Nocardiopsis halophila]